MMCPAWCVFLQFLVIIAPCVNVVTLHAAHTLSSFVCVQSARRKSVLTINSNASPLYYVARRDVLFRPGNAGRGMQL